MDHRKHNQENIWDDGAFGIGSTRPPRDHGGPSAVLLIAMICLCGLASALAVLDIHFFTSDEQAQPSTSSLSFFQTEETRESTAGTEPTVSDSSNLLLEQTPQGLDNIPQEGGLSWQEVYEQNIDSVVSVSCQLSGGSSSGTGVIFSQDGYIVTNCHVVENAQSISVLLTDQRSFTAQLIGADSVSDLAVLRIDAQDLTPARFGDSDQLRVGDAVAAIGDPLGIQLRGSLTDGIVSAINRDLEVQGRKLTLIQTNAALNSGNSGGPLLNCYGQVIGINTMKISLSGDTASVEGIGFAIPSATVKEVVDQLIGQGYVSGRASLGISGEEISSFYRRYYRFPAGLYITQVTEGSAADSAGIQPGDILISLDDQAITSQELLQTFLNAHSAGDPVELVIYRGGRQYALELKLDEAGNIPN